ncbi:MAG: folylpolyglutamate synthase/dihydrofolate synthase family protein [Nonlabens sp.]
MNYEQTLEWLFTQLPMYQRNGKSAYKSDLSNITRLDAHLGHPHRNYPTIHVAGTNGKGSTCHMIASVLQEAGFKVGLYTSPHLKDFRERIRVNGELCDRDFVQEFVYVNKSFFEQQQLSFFEMTVGMAFQYFKREQVDIAVIETGLGGRLDSTNIITPMISVITSIDRDHTSILGNTLTAIASEKAGIIKHHIPVVVGERRGFLRSRFRESAMLKNAVYYEVDHRISSLNTDLLGDYQKDNSRIAASVVKVLNNSGQFYIDPMHLATGLQNVVRNTGLRGRYDILSTRPTIVADTAHNPAGLFEVFKQVTSQEYGRLHVVLGMVNDKEVSKIIALLPKEAMYYLAKPDIPRGMPVELLSSLINAAGLEYTSYPMVSDAFVNAEKSAAKADFILVTGSTFVVAEVI